MTVLVALVAASAGCSSNGIRNVSAATTTTVLTDAPPQQQVDTPFRPRFSPARCPDGVPVDVRITCGWLVVAADRAARRTTTVRLPVAVIRGPGRNRPPDPVVYLAGGPGTSGLNGVEGFLDSGYAGERDVVVFDQRGTGSARPDLNCPEVEAAFKATFATADPAQKEEKVIADGFARCRARLLAEGVTLADFRTETSADDVEDLRIALGFDHIDLYGASYGTALALTVMRRHPEGIRSATLDAVYPTTILNGPAEVASNATRAIDVLVKRCAATPKCSAVAPDLRGALDRAVSRLDARPHEGVLIDPATGDPVPVRITGADVMAGVVNAMYSPGALTALPAAVVALANGDESGIDGVAAQGLRAITGLSEGMAASVECADRARAAPVADLGSVVSEQPEMSTLALISGFGEVCPTWDVPAASAEFSTRVESSIPTLLLSGAFDPVTPPANADAVAAGLTHSVTVVFPAGGHGAVFSSDCAVGIFDQFLSDPDRRPDTTCSNAPETPWA